MTSHVRAGAFQISPLQNFRHKIGSALQDHRWPIWLICSAVSLLSTRHLLIEQYLHYPLQLYINQLIATAAISLCLHSWPRSRKDQGAGEQERWVKTSRRGRSLVISVQYFAMAQSLICTMQAVLHFTNLPALVMLTVSWTSTSCVMGS